MAIHVCYLCAVYDICWFSLSDLLRTCTHVIYDILNFDDKCVINTSVVYLRVCASSVLVSHCDTKLYDIVFPMTYHFNYQHIDVSCYRDYSSWTWCISTNSLVQHSTQHLYLTTDISRYVMIASTVTTLVPYVHQSWSVCVCVCVCVWTKNVRLMPEVTKGDVDT